MLSEEEIIRNVKRIIEYKVISNYINNNDSRAIQGLLDLYYKQQKEIEELKDKSKKQFDILSKYEETLEFYEDKVFDDVSKVINLDEFKKLDKISVKGKKYIAQDLYDKQITNIFNKLNLEFNKDYVSKDKVRRKIKELEKQEDWYIEKKSLDELYGRIDELKELLGEKDDTKI